MSLWPKTCSNTLRRTAGASWSQRAATRLRYQCIGPYAARESLSCSPQVSSALVWWPYQGTRPDNSSPPKDPFPMTCTNQYSHPAHQYSLWFPGRGISAARA